MGTIKMKNRDVETVKTPLADTAIQAAEPIEHPTWDDPAVLREDATFTDEHSRLYYLNNGTAKSVISATSVNYYDEQSKSWQRIDNTLVERDGVLQNNRGGFKAEFSKDGGRQSVKVGKKQRQVAWTYLGKQEGETAVAALRAKSSAKIADCTVKNEQNRAVFENVERQTDLEYSVHGDALKENIIVKEKSDSYRYMFALQTQGLAMRLSDDNNAIELYDETTQEAAFTIPAPYMYDADGVRSDDVYYELEPSGDAYTFAVVAAADWINAENRAMPVTIDPQIVTSASNLLSVSVQRRSITNGPSGENYGAWESTNLYQNIKVGYDGQYVYITDLTVKRSKLQTLKTRIASAKLILRPTKSQNGDFYLDSHVVHYSGGLPITVDITSQLAAGGGDFVLRFEPYSFYSNVEFYMKGEHAPVIQVEYLINENLKPCTRTFDLSGNATAVVDVPTGEVDVQIPAASGEGLSLPYNIYHVFKRSGEDFGCGKNLRLNLHETLKKENTGAQNANYVYTDIFGNKHGFKETFYTLNQNNERVSVAKSNVSVDLDGTLRNSAGKEVFKEEVSDVGWRAVTKLESVAGIELYEQRQSEVKQLEEQVAQYETALKDFVLVSVENEKPQYEAETYLSNDNFQAFLDLISSDMVPLTKNEAQAYYSLALQRDTCNYQKTVFTQQKDDGEWVNKVYSHQITAAELSRRSYGLESNKLGNPQDTASYEYALKQILDQQVANAVNQANDIGKQQTQYNLQLQTNETMDSINGHQYTHAVEQMATLRNKRNLYTKQLKLYYKEYKNKAAELALRKRYMPVNYLTNGSIAKGFNEGGELVVIGDGYENAVVIERNVDGRIMRMTDNKGKSVTFAYNHDGRLTSITDALGRRTEYGYDENDPDRLQTITYADGNTLTLTGAAQLSKITSKYGETSFSYIGTQLNAMQRYNLFTSVQHGNPSGNRTQVSSFAFTYADNQTRITDNENDTVELYEFDKSGNACKYYVQSHGVVTKAEQYNYVKYEKDEIEYARPDTLNLSPLSSFGFTVGEYARTELDAFNIPVKCIAGGKQIDVGINQSAETEYFYDDDRRVVKEYATIAITGQPVKHAVKTYVYNPQGKITRTESYIEEEVVEGGKNVEETVYDQKGRKIKTFTYNTLDTSSKFYTESELDENGKTMAELDQTGENKTKLEYIDGTENVRTQTLPNGSRFAYGHDQSGRVTAITQSTQAGEENSTQIAYTGELATEVKSGNNTVRYAYDGKGRKKAVYLNDLQTPYVSYHYVEETGGGKSVTATLRNDQTLFTETDTKGRLIRSKVGNLQTTFAYDSRGRLTKCTDGISGETSYAYDTLDRVTQITAPAVTETFTYANGTLATKSVTVGGVETLTSYAYKNNAAKDLQSVTIGSTIVKPQTDCLGRNIGKEIHVANKRVASESISYRKAGDHATNMPSSMRFGHRTPADQNVIASEAKQSATDKFVILESLQYKYDTCGNIAEIRENGALYAKYTYDALNRLIREDNKKLNKTVLFTYDNNGNILNKRVLAFTSKTGLELDEMTSVDTVYAYDGDKLLSFGDETCTYDVLGNPTTYRGKTCAWENGRRLKAYDNVTFTYDARGLRTSKTYNGKTTSFTYENAGNLLKQSNGLAFIYDNSGVIGVKQDATTYFYRKNVQGDVIAILDNDGKVVVKYNYDAWGNHEVRDVDGNALTDSTHIGNLNPFRYRGYYYDTETGLYYLKTRYYDPQAGRFITIDGITFINASVNGSNLYVYCANNPIMFTDANGTNWWTDFWQGVGDFFVKGAKFIGGLVVASVGIAHTLILWILFIDTPID